MRKGHSDSAWRQKQLENPNKWQLAWMARFQWAERVPADESKGEMHDRARCVTCSVATGKELILAARCQTLKNHVASEGHLACERHAQQRVTQMALQQAQKGGSCSPG